MYWFYISGGVYAAAIFLLNSALHSGQLVVVSPVVSCQSLFSLLLGYLVFREAALNPRVAGAVVAVVCGVVVLAWRPPQG